MSTSLISQLMQPGGGIILLPLIRWVTIILMIMTSTACYFGFARIHMAILAFLSLGLYLSLLFFEQEFNKVNGGRGIIPPTKTGGKTTTEKSD